MDTAVKKDNRIEKILNIAVLVAVFVLGFLLCCMIKYSDGDDAFFIDTLSKHPSLIDFTTHLTKTMNGRISATVMLWLVFSNSIWVWRAVNAIFFTAFVYLLARTGKIICNAQSTFSFKITGAASFAIIGVGILGYSCLWITGSVNYLWPVTFALIAAQPFITLAFTPEKFKTPTLLLSAIFGVLSCLAQEQIAAVLVSFTGIIIVYTAVRDKKVCILNIAVFLLMLAGLLWLVFSPVSGSRTEKEIARWLPEYASMSFAQHLFITVQWLLHAVANNLRYVFILLAVCLGIGYSNTKKRILSVLSLALAAVTFLSRFGLTDVGLNDLDMTKIVTDAPKFEDLSTVQAISMVFWMFVIISSLTLVVLYFSDNLKRVAVTLIFLAAIASAAIMFFSPTIYASGDRTFFVCATLLILISGVVSYKERTLKQNILFVLVLAATAALQMLDNRADILAYIGL